MENYLNDLDRWCAEYIDALNDLREEIPRAMREFVDEYTNQLRSKIQLGLRFPSRSLTTTSRLLWNQYDPLITGGAFGVTHETANNLYLNEENAYNYSIGWFREHIQLSHPTFWGSSTTRRPRSAIDGFLIAMWTLEFGSTNIHVPMWIRRLFGLTQASNYTIGARWMLQSSKYDENIVDPSWNNFIFRILNNVSHMRS